MRSNFLRYLVFFTLGVFTSISSVQAASVLFPYQGGTGQATLPASQILYGAGANPVQSAATGTISAGSGISVGGTGYVIGGNVTITNTGGGAAGTGNIATSTHETAGQLGYYTSNSATPALLGQVATSSLTVNAPLTTAGTLGALVGGTSLTLGCTTASAGVTGCLSGTDWSTFNNKDSFLFPFTVLTNYNATGTVIGFTGGIFSTASSTFNSNVFFPNLSQGLAYIGTNGLHQSTATSSLGVTGPITFSGTIGAQVGGSAGNFGCATCVLTSRNVNTSLPLTGGGALSGDLTLATLFTTTTNTGLTANRFIYTDPSGILITAASSSLSLPNTALQNSSISGVALGGTLSSHSHDTTLTGTSYNGSAAVSNWGIDLTHANTWTGTQTFGNASSTLFSTSYASSTQYFGANLATCNSASSALTWAAGVFGCNSISGSSGVGLWFVGDTFGGTAVVSTSTSVWFKGTSPYSLMASTTYVSYASTTAISSTNLTSGNCVQASTGGLLTTTGSACGSGGFAFPFTPGTFGGTADNATGTLIGFTNGIFSLASSTIGNGTQTSGLTIAGGATTTGTSTIQTLIVNGNTGHGTTTPIDSLTSVAAATPQLALGDTLDADKLWTLRAAGNQLFLATSTYTATSSKSAFAIDANGIPTFTSLAAGSGNSCLQVDTTGKITNTGSGCAGSGNVGSWFVGDTFGGTGVAATSTAIWFKGSNPYSLMASTSLISYASTTALSASNLTSGNCVQASTGGLLTTTGSACGAGGGGSFPFTPGTFGATVENSTSTLIGFTAGLYSLASTTIGNGTVTGGLTVAGTASSTSLFSTSGNFVSDNSTGTTSIAQLYTGALNFDADAGNVAALSLPVASAANGTQEAINFLLGTTTAATLSSWISTATVGTAYVDNSSVVLAIGTSTTQVGSTVPGGQIEIGASAPNGTTTISMGKIQFEGYSNSGSIVCTYVVGTSWVIQAGRCSH